MHHYPLFVRRRSAEQLRCCVSAQLMLLIAMAWMLIVAVAWMLIVHRQDAQTEGELADHGTVDDCLFYKKRDPKDGINIAADGTCASFNPRTGFPNLVEGLSTVAWTAVEMSMDDSEVVDVSSDIEGSHSHSGHNAAPASRRPRARAPAACRLRAYAGPPTG